MIRECTDRDFESVYSIINDAAQAYKGIIPADRWHEPYMSRHYLQHEIDAGVVSRGYEENGELIGVMGIQDVKDVTLLRHAYVRTAMRGKGIGSILIADCNLHVTRPALVGPGQRPRGQSGSTKNTATGWSPGSRKSSCSGNTGRSPSGRWRHPLCLRTRSGLNRTVNKNHSDRRNVADRCRASRRSPS